MATDTIHDVEAFKAMLETQAKLDTSRMNSLVSDEIVMETVDSKLWVTTRRRRTSDSKRFLKSIAVYPLYPEPEHTS